MEKFITHTGTALPLRQSGIDTDQILPSKYLKRISRTGFEDALFADWRNDPEFALNKPEFAGASILIAGQNFGIGSSREHAVWAIMDYGFKVVVSSQFADIFRGNSGNAGLLAIQVDQSVIEQLWDAIEANPELAVTVDLEACEISAGDIRESFQIDDHTRGRLLAGLDDIEITLSHRDEIETFEQNRPGWRPIISA
jgi:3-isopropylmalate/(R)-2-methylmalate dehydratase small subunit